MTTTVAPTKANRAVAFALGVENTGESKKRVEIRAKTPHDLMMEMFKTKNYDPYINQEKEIIKKITEKPLEAYYDFRQRLEKDGAVASFPEFIPVISRLTKCLYQEEDVVQVFNTNPALSIALEQLSSELLAIQLEGGYMYPYKATVLVIEKMLQLIDIIRRLQEKSSKPYYHQFRYRMYLTWLLDEGMPNIIVFPCISYMGATLLIQTRCVPIALLGVITKTTLADRYPNTPLDFWMHDIQHWRRMAQEDQRYFDLIVKHDKYYTKRSPFNINDITDLYESMYKLSIQLLEKYKEVPSDNEEQKNYKKLKKLIIFEVCHEKGWPLTKFSLCRNIPLGYDTYPVETMGFHMNTGNMYTYEEKITDPTTLSNLYHKLRYGFYDNPNEPILAIVDPKYRTAVDVATAAKELLTELGCKIDHSLEELIGLTQDPSGAEEFTEYFATITTPNKRRNNISYTPKLMPYWQVEPEAPLYTLDGGKKKQKRKTRKNSKQT